MDYRSVLAAFSCVVALSVGASALAVSPDVVDELNQHLYAGDTAQAALVAKQRLDEVPDDDQARFMLGSVQFLQAVENLGRAFHRYGLRSSYAGSSGFAGGFITLPILRLPVPENPQPEPLTYAALRGVLDAFVNDLASAERTLAAVSDPKIQYSLNFGLVRLDLNGDGKAADEEALWRIFKTIGGFPWLDEVAAAQFQTDFDASDVPWLRAYSHLLMAIAEFALAHDWYAAYEATFHGLFPEADLPLQAALDRNKARRAELAELQSRLKGMSQEEQQQSEEIQRLAELQAPLELGGIADVIAFVHLTRWPVVAPERLRQALGHLEAMVALSRESWGRILAETDNANEWIPSPNQTGVLPRMQVTEERVAGWAMFLDEFEALLLGKKLLPHWRFDKGINLRRIFEEPRTFDLVLLIQGSSAVPYLEEGELTTGEAWGNIIGLFGGDFLRFAIWFN
jgi:hypothetical protein